MSDYQWFVMAITRDMESAKLAIIDNMRLIGPFKDGRDAADWGHTHCSPGGPNDPRWNSVLLDTGPLSLTSSASVYPLAVWRPDMTHVKPGSYPMRDMNKPPVVTDEGLHKDAERQREGVTSFKDAHQRAYDMQSSAESNNCDQDEGA